MPRTPRSLLARTLRSAARPVVFAAGLLAPATHAAAQTPYTWNNQAGDSLWDTSLNWSPTGPPTAADTAIFGNIGIGTVNLGATQTVAGLTFGNQAGGYLFTGSPLTIGAAQNTSFNLLNAGAGGTAQFTNQLAFTNTGVTTAVGSGTAWFTNTTPGSQNNFNGTTLTVAGGAVVRGAAGTAAGTNALNGATVQLGGGTLLLDAASAPPATNGLLAREFAGTAYSNAFNAATPGLNNPTGNATTSASWAFATPGNTYTFTNFATTTALNATNPSSQFSSGTTSFGLQLTGRYFAPVSGLYQFQTNTDDGSRILIDGVPVAVNDNGHGAQTINGAPVFLTAGTHTFEYQFLQGTGGYQFGLGIQAPGATSFTTPSASSFAVATAPVGMTTTNVSVADGQTGGVRMNLPDVTPQLNVGTITLGVGSTLNLSTTTPNNFSVLRATATAFGGGAQTVNVPGNTTFAVGSASAAAGAVVNKTGAGTLLFDNSSATNNLVAGTVIDIQQGVVTGVGQGTSGFNPFGSATVRIDGGTLRLDTKFGNPTFAGSPLMVAAVPGNRLEALAGAATTTWSGLVAFSPGASLTADPYAGQNGSVGTAPGATLTLSGGLVGGADTTLTVNSALRNLSGTTGVLPRQFNNTLFGTLSLTANSPSFAGTVTVNQGVLQASGPNAATSTALGTGPLQLNFGRLNLRNNGTASNTTVAFGNAATVTGGLGFGIDVAQATANTGNTLTLGGLTFDTSAANNPQQFSLLQVTGANTYGLGISGATSLNGNVQIDTTTANLTLTGPVTGTGGSLTKTGAGTLIFGGATHDFGNYVATTGTTRVDGSGTIAGNVYAVGGTTVIADNSTAGTAYLGTVDLRNGAVFRLDRDKSVLPVLSTAAPNGAPTAAVLALNVANQTSSLTMPNGVANLFLGTTQATGQYTGGTIVANGNTYLLGGSPVSGTVLRLTGNGVNPVLADVLTTPTNVVIGSTYLTSAGGFQSTVRFDSTAANTYTGNTQIARGFTADVQVGGALTPFGANASSTVTVGGTLSFSGANGTAAATPGSPASANNNTFAFIPGSTLLFDNTTASATGDRWADTAAVNLYGTALTLKGTSTGTTAETVGGITFDGGSVITITRNGGASTTLTAGGSTSLARTNFGTLRITPTGGTLGTGEVLATTGTLPATIGNQAVLPGYVVVENGASGPLPTFALPTGGTIIGLPTASYATTLNGATGGTDVVDVTTATAVSGNPSVAGLRVGAFALTNAGSPASRIDVIPTGTAGNGLGGVIFSGTAAHNVTLNFGANEGLVYVSSGATATFNLSPSATTGGGGITGTGGLTKFGAGTLVLQQLGGTGSAAAALSSTGGSPTVVINEGTLALQTNTGSSVLAVPNTSTVLMNGGTLQIRLDASTTVLGGLTLRGPSGYNIDRAGGTTANNQTLNVGLLVVGTLGANDPAAGTFPLTLTGTTGNSFILGAGAVTLNQDLILNSGRLAFTAGITANGPRNIVLTNGANAFIKNGANNLGGGAIVVQNGTLLADTAATYSLGGPITYYGGASNWASQAATVTDNVQVYSGATFRGTTAITYTPTTGTNTFGVAEQPTPMTVQVLNDNSGTNTQQTVFNNVNVYSTALTVTGFSTTQTGSIRVLQLNQGTGDWSKFTGPIEIQANGGLHLVVPTPATNGQQVLTGLTTLRANAGANSQAELWFSNAAGGATAVNVPVLRFTQTILDSNLRVDPNQPGAVGNNAHVSLGNVSVYGDRQLWIFDAVNVAATVNGGDFGTVTGDAGSILRMATNNTTLGNALLTTDQTPTMKGMVVLDAAAGAAVWQLGASGGLGALGQVAGTVRLDLPAATTLTSKDNFWVQPGGILSGPGLGQLVVNGPATGPRVALDPGAVLMSTGPSLTAANLPAGLAGSAPTAELRFGADVTTNAAGNNTGIVITAGGANGIGVISNDGTGTRTISSGTITAAGPFTIQSRGGSSFLFGGTAANNNVVNILPAAGLPAGYLADVTVTTATANDSTVLLSNNAAGGLAGDMSGVRRFVVTGGVFNNAETLQTQQGSSLGKAGAVFLYNGNAVNNRFNPGTNGANGSGPITMQAGSLFTLDDANNVTVTTGKITLRSGAVLNITTATTIGGVPTGATAPVVESGVIARLGVDNVANLGGLTNPASLFELASGTRTQNSGLTLNRDPLVPWSGMLTTDGGSRTFVSSTGITVGANGAILAGAGPVAATNGYTPASGSFTLTYAGTLNAGGNPLQIGSVSVVDGRTQVGSVAYTGTSAFNNGTTYSPITVAGGATFTTPKTSLNGTSTAAANSVAIDGSLVVNGTAGPQTLNLGAVTTTGLGRVVIPAGTAAGPSVLAVDSISRTNNGLLALNTPTAGGLGVANPVAASERVVVTNAAPANIGATTIAPPWIVNRTDMSYVTYNSGTDGFGTVGFQNVAPTAFASATAADPAIITTSALPSFSGTITKGALVITNNAAAAGTYAVNGTASGTVLQTASGGILINHTAGTSSTILQLGGANTTIDFNGQEAVVYAAVTGATNQLTTINSQLTNIGAAGLTIGGGTPLGGNSAPIRFDVAQAGATWAANGDGDRVLTIQSGTVRLNVTNALPANTAVTIGDGASLDLGNNLASGSGNASFSPSLAGLRGTGVVTNSNQTTTAVAQTVTLAGAGNYTFDGLFVSNGGTTQLVDLNKTGSGTQTFTNNLTTIVRSVTAANGTLNFTGNVSLGNNGGTSLTVNNAAAAVAFTGDYWSSGSVSASAGSLAFSGNSVVVSGSTGTPGNVNVSGGAVQLSGPNTETVFLSGNLNVTGGSVTMNAATAHYVTGSTTFAQTAAGSNVTVQGSYNVFSGPAAFTNNGSVTLNGTNTFNGAATFLQQAGNVTGVNFGANSTTVFNSPMTLDMTAVTTGSAAQVAFNSALTIRGGTVTLAPTGVTVNGPAGLVTVGDNFGSAAATLVAGAPNVTVARPLATGNGSGAYTIGSTAAGGTTTFTGPVTLNGPAQITAALGGAVVFTNTFGSGTVNAGLTKVGGGDLALAGASTYTGGTAVTVGRLFASNATGSATGTGAVVVGTGAALGGTGTVGGPVVANAGGTVRPGDVSAAGTLTAGGGVTFSANSAWQVSLTSAGTPDNGPGGSSMGTLPNPTNHNFLNVTGGSSTIDPNLSVSVTGTGVTLNPGSSYSYRIGSGFGNQGGLSVTNPGQFAVSGFDASGYSISLTGDAGGAVYLNFTPAAVPEPVTVGLIAVSTLGLGSLVRRRRRA
jgi:autotransporter-associated beta strand protein